MIYRDWQRRLTLDVLLIVLDGFYLFSIKTVLANCIYSSLLEIPLRLTLNLKRIKCTTVCSVNDYSSFCQCKQFIAQAFLFSLLPLATAPRVACHLLWNALTIDQHGKNVAV